MAYTINLTNGTTLTTIADGTVNQTSTSLTLIGKNYAGYGTFLNDNFVHLLENASSDTALYRLCLQNQKDDNPDFMIDLGDFLMTDKLRRLTTPPTIPRDTIIGRMITNANDLGDDTPNSYHLHC